MSDGRGDQALPLTRANLSRRPGGSTVVPVLRPSEPGILHLGLGSFHRAHQAVHTAQAIDRGGDDRWGIVGVASRSTRVVDAMRAQQHAYSVLTLSPGEREAQVVDVHLDTLVAAHDPERLVEWIANPKIRVLTLTVSEHGYTYAPTDGSLDATRPDVLADLAGGAPRTTIGQLARGLQQRFVAGAEPITVLSCDNLLDNGGHTRRLICEFLDAAGAGQRSSGTDLMRWIGSDVAFPSTMVDRIVPATTDEHRRIALDLLGVADQIPVPAEPFSMWVIQDAFTAGRPAWEDTGALLTDDVHPYELLKLRLLNGTHSLIAYLGLLDGHLSIDQAIAEPAIRAAAENFMQGEMLSTLTVPHGIDIDDYCSQLMARFANSAIGHRTSQVGSDGSLKLPVRITDPVRVHAARGQVPRLIALLVAAYIRCVASPEVCTPELIGPLRDPSQPQLMELARRYPDPVSLVPAVLADSGVFDPLLAESTGFEEAVVDLYRALEHGGVAVAVAEASS